MKDGTAIERRRLLIHGRVQGVGFRFFAREVANSLRLAGTVRNLPDGRVEAVIQGASESVVRFLASMREGPPGAHVTSVESTAEPPDSTLSTFTITR